VERPAETRPAARIAEPAAEPARHPPHSPQIIRRLAVGDRRALGVLYDGYAELLNAQAMRILRDLSQAEAVVQEVFVRVWHEARNYDSARDTVEAWLVQLARGIALERRRQQIALPQGSPGGLNSLWDEDALAVRKAIDTLPPDQRRLMNMAYFGGCSVAEIGQRLGLPPEAVTERCRVAMQRVRQALNRLRLERWGVAPMVVQARVLSRLEQDDRLAS
jgi:RNA polymerase sigma-70 factor (ECF subfamily)